MSDRADSDAWQVAPQRYLERHPPRFGAAFERSSRYVTVRDGTRLAADIYLPVERRETHLPAILVFTPYYRRFALVAGALDTVEASPGAAAYRDAFVPQGYALVVVDTRGAGASFGTRDGFRSPVERDDYFDLVDWLIVQPWSDGRVGAIGVSYVGAAAVLSGRHRPSGGARGGPTVRGVGHVPRPPLPGRPASQPAGQRLSGDHGGARPGPPRPPGAHAAFQQSALRRTGASRRGRAWLTARRRAGRPCREFRDAGSYPPPGVQRQRAAP